VDDPSSVEKEEKGCRRSSRLMTGSLVISLPHDLVQMAALFVTELGKVAG